jgi:hypothetical protein
MPRRFWQYGFVCCGGKADMPKWYQSSHYPHPIECTQILAMRAVPALSESEHGDRLKEASDTLHRKYCTNGSRPPSWPASC